MRPRVAVILAAGRSSRLHALTRGSSKVALRLGGLSLVERNVRALLSLGIERVVVVVGHDAHRVEECLTGIPEGQLVVLRADGWEPGNSASLMAAERLVAGEPLFLIQAADHLLSSGAIRTLLGAGQPAVLIDSSPGAAWIDGTRVRVVDDRVVTLSKDLDDPAIDCGAFVVSPAIFAHFAAPASRQDYSLAAMLTGLAGTESIRAVPLPCGEWWCDIDTPSDLARASRLLRRSLGKPTDGPISRFVNRPISTRLSMQLARWSPSPTLLTLATSSLAGVAALLLASGQGIAGGLVAQMTAVLDGVDGEIARLQFRTSPQGAFLDSVLDRLGDTALVAGLGYWTATEGVPSGPLSVLVAATTAAVILSMATKDRVELLGLRVQRDRYGASLLGSRDGRLLLVAVGAILGQPLLSLIAIAVTSGAGLIPRTLFVFRAPRDDG